MDWNWDWNWNLSWSWNWNWIGIGTENKILPKQTWPNQTKLNNLNFTKPNLSNQTIFVTVTDWHSYRPNFRVAYASKVPPFRDKCYIGSLVPRTPWTELLRAGRRRDRARIPCRARPRPRGEISWGKRPPCRCSTSSPPLRRPCRPTSVANTACTKSTLHSISMSTAS